MPVKFDASEAIAGIEKIKRGIPQSVEDTLTEAADLAIKVAKDVVPVDTGRLRDSIDILEQGEDYVIVGSDVEYAFFVEFGTVKMEAQPYLSPALDQVTSRFVDILVGFLEENCLP